MGRHGAPKLPMSSSVLPWLSSPVPSPELGLRAGDSSSGGTGGLRAPCVTWGQEAATHWGFLRFGHPRNRARPQSCRSFCPCGPVTLVSPVLCLEL